MLVRRIRDLQYPNLAEARRCSGGTNLISEHPLRRTLALFPSSAPFMMPSMSWREIAPGAWGEQLRLGILAAIEQVYDENCQRFAPEDIGDNNMTFGITVSENLHFVIERDVIPVTDGAVVEKPRNAWMVRLWGGVVLHIYKAPPGAIDVRELRFNASKTKLELVSQNADQLELFEKEKTHTLGSKDLHHVVIVHFGDPQNGLRRVDVGAPILDDVLGYDWTWVDALSELDPYQEDDASEGEVGSDSVDDEDFGLEMRDDVGDDERRDLPGQP